MKKVLLGIVLLNLVTACASHKTPAPSQPENKPPVAEAPVAPVVAPASGVEGTTGTASPAEVNAQALATAEAAKTAAAAEAETARVAAEAEAAKTAEAARVAAAAEAEKAAAAALVQRRVHFDFDSDAVLEADKAVIQTQGAYLGLHPELKVRVEGNADERGSSEYNLALGQRRANSTKKALTLAGAKAAQIETISYGEEKPLATGHDEESWAQNRRVDIAY
jgi:peptidoglycan-associated lipoprotein